MLARVLRQIELASIWRHKRKGLLFLSDTTLRDGEQMPGVRLNPDEKVEIAQALARVGIHSIDAGFPATSREEIESIRQIAKTVRGPVINAHCRTLKADIDAAREALDDLSLFRRAVTLFIGISKLHREQKHHKTKSEIIRLTVDAIQYAKQYFQIVTFGPEDASRTEPDFLHEIYQEAIEAGATTCGFADTVGYLTPSKAVDCIKGVQDNVPSIGHAMLAVHFHNDLGMGTANALACVKQGVNIVQGTINGLGERAGNTPLEEVIMAISLHSDEFPVRCHIHTEELYALSRLVARLTGVEPAPAKAVIGKNVFRTEAGVHQDGVLKDPSVYLPFLPEQIGAPPVELVLGKHSGRRAVAYRSAEVGTTLTDQQVERVLKYLKNQPRLRSYASAEEVRSLLAEVLSGDLPNSPGAESLAATTVIQTVAATPQSREQNQPKKK
ncbi:MAG: pyruvate carboxyltransferase [Planctomycetes bacterium]|jgi:2-isopropylmalate synthase|nr:pyruvate carboxyltransferase [Planctomycetota bacterium]